MQDTAIRRDVREQLVPCRLVVYRLRRRERTVGPVKPREVDGRLAARAGCDRAVCSAGGCLGAWLAWVVHDVYPLVRGVLLVRGRAHLRVAPEERIARLAMAAEVAAIACSAVGSARLVLVFSFLVLAAVAAIAAVGPGRQDAGAGSGYRLRVGYVLCVIRREGSQLYERRECSAAVR